MTLTGRNLVKRKDGLDRDAIRRAVARAATDMPVLQWCRLVYGSYGYAAEVDRYGNIHPSEDNRQTRKRARPNRKVPTHKGNRK